MAIVYKFSSSFDDLKEEWVCGDEIWCQEIDSFGTHLFLSEVRDGKFNLYRFFYTSGNGYECSMDCEEEQIGVIMDRVFYLSRKYT